MDHRSGDGWLLSVDGGRHYELCPSLPAVERRLAHHGLPPVSESKLMWLHHARQGRALGRTVRRVSSPLPSGVLFFSAALPTSHCD